MNQSVAMLGRQIRRSQKDFLNSWFADPDSGETEEGSGASRLSRRVQVSPSTKLTMSRTASSTNRPNSQPRTSVASAHVASAKVILAIVSGRGNRPCVS
jgi:hypothetical protein